jgi:ribosomal protein L37AE/L43A
MTTIGLRCPACGELATGRFIAGDWHLCRGCGAWSAAVGEDPLVLVQKTDPDVKPTERRRQVRQVVEQERSYGVD